MGVSQLGRAAVERRRAANLAAIEARNAQWRHDYRLIAFGSAVGGLLGIGGTLLGVLLSTNLG